MPNKLFFINSSIAIAIVTLTATTAFAQIFNCHSGGTGTAQQCTHRDAQAQSQQRQQEQIFQCHSGGTGTAQQCTQRDVQAQSQQRQQEQIFQCHSGGTGTAQQCTQRDAQAQSQQEQGNTVISQPQVQPQTHQMVDWSRPQPNRWAPEPGRQLQPTMIIQRERDEKPFWKNTAVPVYPLINGATAANPHGEYVTPENFQQPSNLPQPPRIRFQGAAGVIQDACWDMDCGGVVGDALIRRGRNAVVREIIK